MSTNSRYRLQADEQAVWVREVINSVSTAEVNADKLQKIKDKIKQMTNFNTPTQIERRYSSLFAHFPQIEINNIEVNMRLKNCFVD